VMEEHRRSGSAGDQDPKEEGGRSSAVGSRWASSTDLPNAMSMSVLSDASTNTNTTTTATPEIGDAPPPGMLRDLVDVSVKVSAGRWEVEGQKLRWWYDVPKEGEESKKYTIEITRRPGVIKEAPGAAAAGRGEKSWWEMLCDEEGCCVM